MKINVLFFASTREIIGASRLSIDLPEFSTTENLIAILVERYPSLKSGINEISIAINKEYTIESIELKDGDEVALVCTLSDLIRYLIVSYFILLASSHVRRLKVMN